MENNQEVCPACNSLNFEQKATEIQCFDCGWAFERAKGQCWIIGSNSNHLICMGWRPYSGPEGSSEPLHKCDFQEE